MTTRVPNWLWYVVAFAVVLGAMYFVSDARRNRPPATPAAPAAPGPTVYDREEFRAVLLGKTPDEVLARIGTPDSTQDYAGRGNWYYRGRTRDPVTGDLDARAQVVFRDGRVKSVNFH